MENNSLENKENTSIKTKKRRFKSWGENSHPRTLRIKKWLGENKRFLVTVIACILIVGMMLVQTLYMTNQIGMLTNQLSYLLDTNSIMQEQLENLEDNIADTLEENNSMLSSCDIHIKDIDFANETYTASVSLKLKEFTKDTTVDIYFGAELFELTQNKDTNAYEGEAVLPVSENYDGNVTVLVTNGETRNTEIIKDYQGLMHLLEKVLYGRLEVFPTYSEGTIKIPGVITADANTNDYFQFEKLSLIVTADDQVIYESNYNNEEADQAEADTESLEQENTESDLEETASDKATTKETPEEGEIEVPSTEEEAVTVLDGGEFEFQNVEIKDIPENKKVKVYLSLLTTEGYEFQYLIFDGETAGKTSTNDDDEQSTYEGWVLQDDYFPYTYTVYDLHKNPYVMGQ